MSGLLAGLALIIAIGAQNAYVLRQGVLRHHVGTVALICLLSDALLIALGTGGVGLLVQQHPDVLVVLRWLGAAYLAWFAISSFRTAARPHALEMAATASKGSVVATTLALTYLNPHVYLDTVVMLGSLANQFGSYRWVFAAGAATGSVLWFTGLAYGARALRRPLAQPRTWRWIDVVIGVTMLGFAARLALV